jgi:transposase InsO family protein
MSQIYHSNAETNVNIRSHIQQSDSSNKDLAVRYNISENTVSKWRNRHFQTDVSSRPAHIAYALTDFEQYLACQIRRSTWLSLEEVFEMMLCDYKTISRSSIYRAFCRENINQVPQEKKELAKKFKEYEPGYLHVDVTYLPTLNGQKSYLFVAIDRATRAMYFKQYDQKTAINAENFMQECIDFFSFTITHVLTDNGLEFTNALLKSKKGELCKKASKLDEVCEQNGIEHRLTKPATPKTNGMVERVNGTIKNATILINKYANKDEMTTDLTHFLMFYNLFRRHGSLKKELNVKTPFDALEKWYVLKPELFKENPESFKNKIITLHKERTEKHQQPCET